MKIRILPFLLVILLFGCKGAEIMSEIHDTIVSAKHDSFVHIFHNETVFNTKDSVSHVEYVRGDTIFVKDFRYILNERMGNRSDSIIRAELDSLRRSKASIEPVYIEKPLSWKEKALQKLGSTFLLILALMVSYILIRIAVKKDFLRKLLNL